MRCTLTPFKQWVSGLDWGSPPSDQEEPEPSDEEEIQLKLAFAYVGEGETPQSSK